MSGATATRNHGNTQQMTIRMLTTAAMHVNHVSSVLVRYWSTCRLTHETAVSAGGLGLVMLLRSGNKSRGDS